MAFQTSDVWEGVEVRALPSEDRALFEDAVRGLKAGDFSRLEPLFAGDSPEDGRRCRIVEWCEAGLFDGEHAALEEALTCACFLGRVSVADYLMERGVDPSAGAGTGLDGFHWAANRGQLETVRLLIRRGAPLETRSMYGGTVLGSVVWAASNEPMGEQLHVIEALLEASARLEEAGYPTGDERVDEVLRRHGAA